MTTDNRSGDSLFPDVTEHYGAESVPEVPVSEASAALPVPDETTATEPVVAPDPLAVPDPPDPPVVPGPGEVFRTDAAPEPVAAPEPEAEFDQLPTWLVTAPTESSAEKSPRRRALLIAGGAVALLVIAAVTTVVALGTGDEIAGSPNPVAGSTAAPRTSTTVPQAPAQPAGWCADSVADGRSVGRGPGSADDGPGAIRAFDYAYYVDRDGSKVASLMVTPNAVPDIQKWIDEVPLGTEHCVTVAPTADPNVFEVDLGLRSPAGSDGVIRQRVTVAPSPTGFKIAKVEDLR
ncbi:Serine/threonine protein kinase [Prescottella defluvii]|uniref:hypothetical protein n=1 Tax=Prescottella defluvii TaxID=1323361 RepID=UPI0004F3AF5A|nr:hypothetical protein [Prescottella defluvii]